MKFKSLLAWATLAYSGQSTEALPMPRHQAPNFKDIQAVVNEEFKQISLTDYKGKYLIVVFYPFDFTYVCPTELISFSENLPKF